MMRPTDGVEVRFAGHGHASKRWLVTANPKNLNDSQLLKACGVTGWLGGRVDHSNEGVIVVEYID